MTAYPLVMPAAMVALLIAGTGAMACWIPRLTRPDIYFAVTVPAGFRDSAEGRRIMAGYRSKVVVYSLIALGLIPAGARLGRLDTAFLVGLLGQAAGYFAAYYRARRRVIPHATAPSTVRQATLEPRTLGLPGGWILQFGPFILLAAAAAYLNYHWAEIPERFPIHWGIDGQPNGWATRTLSGVYGSLLMGLVMCGGLALVGYGVAHWSRRIQTSGPAAEHERHFRRAVLWILLASEYFLALVIAWTELLPLTVRQSGPPGVSAILVLSVAFAVATTLMLVRLGQGGTRLGGAAGVVASAGVAPPVGDRTLDCYWKAGIFYVNPDDPALIVEKRFGIGYTINFGRPASWVVLAALLLAPLLIAFLLKFH